MRFEWDERKNIRNRAKHRVSFETATLVFEDPRVVSILDRIEENEERWHTIGMAGGMLLLLVVHTFRGKENDEIARIISARKATPRERAIYEEAI
jgi:uncharacterized DUF497 family protein